MPQTEGSGRYWKDGRAGNSSPSIHRATEAAPRWAAAGAVHRIFPSSWLGTECRGLEGTAGPRGRPHAHPRAWDPAMARGDGRDVPGLLGQRTLGAVDRHLPAAPRRDVGAAKGQEGATALGTEAGVQGADLGLLGRDRGSGVGSEPVPPPKRVPSPRHPGAGTAAGTGTLPRRRSRQGWQSPGR